MDLYTDDVRNTVCEEGGQRRFYNEACTVEDDVYTISIDSFSQVNERLVISVVGEFKLLEFLHCDHKVCIVFATVGPISVSRISLYLSIRSVPFV